MRKDRTVWTLCGLAIVLILCHMFICGMAFVYGISMEPTLKSQDCVLVWKLCYQPKQGDIVITKQDADLAQNLVKRVIAVEGQTIYFSANHVSVDGVQLEEPYLKDDEIITYEEMRVTVPEGEVFLMGDNRMQSIDSRTMGCVSAKELKGKVILRIFPFHQIKPF